ncbi:uncharacterized protein [Diadema antillarum]|uniref:uncharacterized protein n=1 Tax=Diadema antillarum TaxID=105358 RepID=UPI003A8B60EA
MSPTYASIAVLLTLLSSALTLPFEEEKARWLEAMGLADKPGIYVGPGPVDMEISGDLPFGLEGSADQPPIRDEGSDLKITDLLIAVDHRGQEESFIPSSSSSISSIVEASVSSTFDIGYGMGRDQDIAIDEEEEQEMEQPSDRYAEENELGMGAIDNALPDDGVINPNLHPNEIPDAFQNGANAETGPESDLAINRVLTKARSNYEENQFSFKEASESQQASKSGKSKKPPNVMKYTAVIGVVMVAGAVGIGTLLSAVGIGVVRLIRKARRGDRTEA